MPLSGPDCRKTPGRHRRAAALRFWFRNRRRVRRFRLPCAARLSLRSLPPGEPQASRQRALPVRKDRPQAIFFDGLNSAPLVQNYLCSVCQLAASSLPASFYRQTPFLREVSATAGSCSPPSKWWRRHGQGLRPRNGGFQTRQAHKLVFACDRKSAHICRPLFDAR